MLNCMGMRRGFMRMRIVGDDLMQVIGQFDVDADPQGFKELTEASDVESVKERIFSN